uniref:Protein DOG1-like 4 n=1 Tax=Tanacetum cinerariifolium TaxID=118510 RepID=A0A6L2KYJ1_TANCI|nr:protein DOG1-like 4 [Tanacetum cinerariifolium]
MSTRRSVGRSNTNLSTFQNFYQGWLVRQEQYLEELRSVLQYSNEFQVDQLRALINRVFIHYQEYYEQKSRIANHDVFLVFCPPWYSAFERSFFWIAGVKPGLAFQIIRSSVDDLSQEQVDKIEILKAETRAEEKEIGDEMARIQETVAAPPIVEVMKKFAVEEFTGTDEAIDVLKAELEVVLANADMLRTRTAERVIDILAPLQSIKFLAALTEFKMKLRIWGSELSR